MQVGGAAGGGGEGRLGWAGPVEKERIEKQKQNKIEGDFGRKRIANSECKQK
jgi:hypothetical protein